ncbi:MAG: transglutaminase domain-containing protein [Bacteroidetes bacterium]|nr:transglutaminase domain-containing protein [Bacteroidota bacterium]
MCSKKRSLLFLIALLVLVANSLKAQEFQHYAHVQDSLTMIAYDKRDPKEFSALLKDFEKKYKTLSKEDKKEYDHYYYGMYYNLCCTYALLGNKEMALNSFEKSIAIGYDGYYHILEDKDLDGIRNEPRFIKILNRLKETGDYMYILKKAKDYNSADERTVPVFTYQRDTSESLQKLRKTLNLDSIAGYGNETSRMINILHWVHNNISHDGSHSNPAVYNALGLLNVCKKDSRGLNCRGLVFVLNECYLAMGYPSRLVTCMPKDSLGKDQDCHVIDAVYSRKLKKWLWMDPTHDAYIMNEKGELLGIQEVRERLINGQTLIVNPDANWNHKNSTVKEDYLDYYMAKNLYKLQCPVNSVYDLESRKAGKTLEYVELLPVEYYKQKPDKTVDGDAGKETVFIRYRTNNADKFWQAPVL